MLFCYSNKKNNPDLLYTDEFKESEFPIRMTDERVFDRFVDWVLAAKVDQITGLPFFGKKGANVDHMHGLPGYVKISNDG